MSSIGETSPSDNVSQGTSNIVDSLTSKISHLATTSLEVISNNKVKAGIGGLIIVGGLAFLTWKAVMANSVSGKLETLLSSFESKNKVSLVDVKKFLEQNWDRLGFDECFDNDSVREVLAQDITAILENTLSKEPVSGQVKAVLTQIEQMQLDLSGALKDVKEDIEGSEEFRTQFGIDKNDTPVSIRILVGDKGERRFLIGFQQSEKQICWMKGSEKPVPVSSNKVGLSSPKQDLFYPIPPGLLLNKEAVPGYRTETHTYCSYFDKSQVQELANNFAENWLAENFGGVCNNKTNREFLAKKIFAVLTDHYEQPTEVKNQIIQNVLNNFGNYLSTQLKTVTRDIKEDSEFQKIFGIENNDEIQSVRILADETHNKGSAPLHLILKSGKELVIKPRSMLPEKILCGGEQSLLGQSGIGFYKVHNKEKYGYSEFIKNEENGGNVFHASVDYPTKIEDVPGLKEYADKFIEMDRIARLLGLTDLHSGNIITINGCPIPIDVEAIMLPTTVDAYREAGGTCLLTTGTAGFKFYEESHKSQIWVKGQNGVDIPRDQVVTLLNDYIRSTKYFQQTYALNEPEPLEIDPTISKAREMLSIEPQRIVLVTTQDAVNIIKRSPENGFRDFCNFVEDGMQAWGFEPTIDLNKLRGFFEEDLANNDAPIFHFVPGEKLLLYHGQVIGQLSKSVKY